MINDGYHVINDDIIIADVDGFVKVLSDKKTDRMLGAHIIGSVSYFYYEVVTLIPPPQGGG